MNVHAQGIKLAVLSPTANKELYLGDKLFFDYAPLDSNSRYIGFVYDPAIAHQGSLFQSNNWTFSWKALEKSTLKMQSS